MDDISPELTAIVAEAQRLAGPDLPWRLHDRDGAACVVFEYEADDAVLSTRLHRGLAAFCQERGIPPRFVVARSTRVRWVSRDQPRIPDFPPD